MAIKISLEETDSRLFCCSKWWGDPDMPEDMAYPMVKGEDGEEYPLTFVCQIDCADIAAIDPDSGLPADGMLYFFAALDEYLGYDVPIHNGQGKWPKGAVKVKYARNINPETFESYIMVDEDDQPSTMPALKMDFSVCKDNEPCLRLLGTASGASGKDAPAHTNLLRIDPDEVEELDFESGRIFSFLLSQDELNNGWWHSSIGYLA